MPAADLARPKWPDRPFRFGNPPWMLADFTERLRGTLLRVESQLRGVSDQSLRARPDGSWSLLQNAGHLGDVDQLWLDRVEDLKAGRAVLAPANAAHFSALAEKHQGQSPEAVLEYLDRRRATLVRVLEDADESLQRVSSIHERLGTPMRLVDLAQFAAEHDDHHLLRMRELRREFAILPP